MTDAAPQATFDVFMSYAHADAARVKSLVAALRARGLNVWLDETHVETFESITRRIQDGLGQSKALLAFYSQIYPTRRACQWELTAAFLASQHERQNPRQRVLVINPEAAATHILPIQLRDARFFSLPLHPDPRAEETLAAEVQAAVAKLSSPLLDVQRTAAPLWHGSKGLGSSRFVGRQEAFWQIHSALFANDSALITDQSAPGHAQVRGLGGMGKSLLAEEYALRFGGAYPGGVFFLRGHENLDDQLRVFALRLQLSVDGLNPHQIEASLEAALRRAQLTYLWLVDDLPGDLDEPARRQWFAPNGFGKTLITTRSRRYGATGGVIELGVLEPEPSYQLLTAQRPPRGDDEASAAREIVSELGQHALALDVAGGAVAQVSYREFLAQIRTSDADVLASAAELGPELPNGHERSITATLWRSVGLLDDSGRDFLRLASVLSAHAIPQLLVDIILKTLGANSPWGAAAVSAPVERYCLADSVIEADGSRAYLVHPLVSQTMRLQDDDSARRGTIRIMTVSVLFQMLAAFAPDIRLHQALSPFVAHARHLVADVRTEQDTKIGLWWWLGRYDYERGSYFSAQTLQEQALDGLRRLLGDEAPNTLHARASLSLTLHAQGKFADARRHQELTLEATQRQWGDDHPATLTARNNLAGTLFSQGDLAGARRLQEAVLEALQRKLGPENPTSLVALLNLAATLRSQGDLAGARAHQEVVLEANRRRFGDDYPATLTAGDSLASTLAAQGHLSRALELQNVVLEARSRVLGEDHPDTLHTLDALAGTLHAQGELAAALAHRQRAAEAMDRVLGELHPAVLTVRSELAELLYEQGDLDGALALQAFVLKARLQAEGDEHPDSLMARLALARTLRARGDQAGAELQEEAIRLVMIRLFIDKHPDSLAARHRLAQAVFKLGDRVGQWLRQEIELEFLARDAGAMGETSSRPSTDDDADAVEARVRPVETEHEEAVLARVALALTLKAAGNFEQAGLQLHAALETLSRVLEDEGHPDITGVRLHLAAVLVAQGRLEDARAHQEMVLEARVRALGAEDADTLEARSHLGGTLCKLGEFDSARIQQQIVLDVQRRVLGDDHPETLLARHNLFGTLYEKGEYDNARLQQEMVLASQSRVLGDDDPATLEARTWVAAALFMARDFASARAQLEILLEARRRVLGDDHEETLDARRSLVGTLCAQNDLKAARSQQEHVLAVTQKLFGSEHANVLKERDILDELAKGPEPAAVD